MKRRVHAAVVILLVCAAMFARRIVREVDPELAVQAAVVHDPWEGPGWGVDPWGRPLCIWMGYHDSSSVVQYSRGPDGENDGLKGDDIVPAFFFRGWGWSYGDAGFPPAVDMHNIVMCSEIDWHDPVVPWFVPPLDRDRTTRLVTIAQDPCAHIAAAIVGWSREVFLGAALLLAFAPYALKQLLAPRRRARVEVARAAILASPIAVLAAWVGWSWSQAHDSALLVIVPRPAAAALSGAAVAFVGALLFRLTRESVDVKTASAIAPVDVGRPE